MDAPQVVKRRKRIVTLIISYLFLLIAIACCFASCAILKALNGYVPAPDQTDNELLTLGVGSLVLIVSFWIADAFYALISLVFGLVSIRSDIRAVKILAIASSALSVLAGVFPIIFGHLNP